MKSTPMPPPPCCPACKRAMTALEGCAHIVCPSRKPWGDPTPAVSDPIGWPGNGCYKTRALRGAP
jgi:hypothetical protein